MMNNKGVLQLIYKVLFQADKTQSPLREATKSIYLEADSAVEARPTILNLYKNYLVSTLLLNKNQKILN